MDDNKTMELKPFSNLRNTIIHKMKHMGGLNANWEGLESMSKKCSASY